MCGGFCLTGNNLSSQAASSPVLSTRGSLTAVFGMGTGGASQPSSPDLNGLFVFPPRQACVSLARHTSVCLRGARWPFLAASTKILVQLDGLFRLLPSIRPENPHPFFQVFSDLQNFTEETTSKKLTCLPCLTFKSSPRRISTGPLNTLLHLHSRPINLVFYKASY